MKTSSLFKSVSPTEHIDVLGPTVTIGLAGITLTSFARRGVLVSHILVSLVFTFYTGFLIPPPITEMIGKDNEPTRDSL